MNRPCPRIHSLLAQKKLHQELRPLALANKLPMQRWCKLRRTQFAYCPTAETTIGHVRFWTAQQRSVDFPDQFSWQETLDPGQRFKPSKKHVFARFSRAFLQIPRTKRGLSLGLFPPLQPYLSSISRQRECAQKDGSISATRSRQRP